MKIYDAHIEIEDDGDGYVYRASIVDGDGLCKAGCEGPTNARSEDDRLIAVLDHLRDEVDEPDGEREHHYACED
jgi:hypothetical protein